MIYTLGNYIAETIEATGNSMSLSILNTCTYTFYIPMFRKRRKTIIKPVSWLEYEIQLCKGFFAIDEFDTFGRIKRNFG